MGTESNTTTYMLNVCPASLPAPRTVGNAVQVTTELGGKCPPTRYYTCNAGFFMGGGGSWKPKAVIKDVISVSTRRNGLVVSTQPRIKAVTTSLGFIELPDSAVEGFNNHYGP